MAETQKRLKKNISFSAHEKDIYDYLEEQGNASAFIKRLILNQMMIDRGIVYATVAKGKGNETEGNVQCETIEKDNQKTDKQSEEVIVTSNKSEELNTQDNSNNEGSNEPKDDELTVDKELSVTVETNFTEDDLKTKYILPEL